MKRIIAISMVAILVVAMVPAFSAYATDVPTDEVPIVVPEPSEYDAYLAEQSAFQKAAESVEKEHRQDFREDQTPVELEMEIPVDGLYTIGLDYKTYGVKTDPVKIELSIDGQFLYAEIKELEYPRMWTTDGEIVTDGMGNQVPKEQVPYGEFYKNVALNTVAWSGDPYLVALTAGVHTVKITPLSDDFEMQAFFFGGEVALPNYTAPADQSQYYDGGIKIIEGENAVLTNSYWITSKADGTSPNVHPHNPKKNLLNFVGGNWSSSGETITWETTIEKAGYYQVGFSYRQSAVIGASSYRKLLIDGKIPFVEATTIAFPYGTDWQTKTLSDANGTPYLVYLDEGPHEISMDVTMGEMTEVTDLLLDAVDILGDLYMDIVMITGETVDIYRDYELFTQIPDMEQRLKDVQAKMNQSLVILEQVSGSTSGSHFGVIKSMMQVVDQMLNNKYTAHRYKNNYYNSYCSISATLSEMRAMPLDLDRIYLSKPGEELPKGAGFFKSIGFSIHRLAASFYLDYNNVSGSASSDKVINIWVNWGQDQAQVLNNLNKKFTKETGIHVNLKIVNASMVQAVLSGKGPSAFLQHSRSEPVNLAMRGVLVDLSTFEDCDEVLQRFQKGAEVPYRYKGGVYALPDTQNFYMMFYRTDIFEQLGLEVPETWDEYIEVTKILARNNLDASLPYLQITAATTTNAGVGSLSLFPSLVVQRGLSLYAEDGKSTTLSSPEIIQTFNDWTDFYTKLKIPVTVNFLNRFRTGTCPIGIELYSLYRTLEATAPEIEGAWDFAPIPGTVREDGTISHASTAGGTACAILKTNEQEQQWAWEYLKWWTDTDTQTTYSMNVESILGPTGRVCLSNTEAMLNLSWEDEAVEKLDAAWSEVVEIPEVPGSYYIARSIDHCFWNVVNDGQIPKDMLNKWGVEVDNEIARKWKQYENR